MIREAVALGVPAYSVFTGQMPAVDERLVHEGRLLMIREPEGVGRIQFVKHDKKMYSGDRNTSLLEFFVNEFARLARKSCN